jgi:uncharacterized membrane protein (UPF0127 family)
MSFELTAMGHSPFSIFIILLQSRINPFYFLLHNSAQFFLFPCGTDKFVSKSEFMEGSVKRNILIAAVVLVGAAVLLKPYMVDRKTVSPSENAAKPKAVEPLFKKEGALAFLTNQKDTLKLVEMEVADNDEERNQGMMYRSAMSYDRAMLFIMEYETQQSFWMHNTKMSLDILYVDGQGQIVTIYKHTQPYSDSPIPSFKRAKYVVETAAGFCDKYGVKEGDFIEFRQEG